MGLLSAMLIARQKANKEIKRTIVPSSRLIERGDSIGQIYHTKNTISDSDTITCFFSCICNHFCCTRRSRTACIGRRRYCRGSRSEKNRVGVGKAVCCTVYELAYEGYFTFRFRTIVSIRDQCNLPNQKLLSIYAETVRPGGTARGNYRCADRDHRFSKAKLSF